MYTLEKPNLSHLKIERVLGSIMKVEDFPSIVSSTEQPEYLYWDKVRYKCRPKELTAEEYWGLIKFFRVHSPYRVQSAVRGESGGDFTWQQLPGLQQFLHHADMHLGGWLVADEVSQTKEKYRFISRGIMEEAIASSQLEGANTTRRAAKRMLLERRRPKNRSEHMILNNHQTMVAIESGLRDVKMDRSLLLDIHARLTQNTIDSKDVGRLRKNSDQILVMDASDNTIYHIPPNERFLVKEIDRLIAYANDSLPDKAFVHPIVKAMILHFWVGYLHPFVDGNGRMARSLFYWYLLRNDYWAFSYLPLSRVIRNSPAQYRDAFVYSEQDDQDLTYFIDYNMRKISQAQREFQAYVKRKQAESQRLFAVAKSKYRLNDRQIQLLRYLYKNANASTTLKTHAQIYSISRVTAARDLRHLEELGLLTSHKVGREVPYQATSKLSELLE